MANADLQIAVPMGAVITPGDRVLVCFSNPDLNQESATQTVEKLRERFPGVEFTIVAGVSGVLVQRMGKI